MMIMTDQGSAQTSVTTTTQTSVTSRLQVFNF